LLFQAKPQQSQEAEPMSTLRLPRVVKDINMAMCAGIDQGRITQHTLSQATQLHDFRQAIE
jgi:hypothetical protein